MVVVGPTSLVLVLDEFLGGGGGFFSSISSSTLSSILSNGGGGGGPLPGYFGFGGALNVGVFPPSILCGGPLIGAIFTLTFSTLSRCLFNDDSACIVSFLCNIVPFGGIVHGVSLSGNVHPGSGGHFAGVLCS